MLPAPPEMKPDYGIYASKTVMFSIVAGNLAVLLSLWLLRPGATPVDGFVEGFPAFLFYAGVFLVLLGLLLYARAVGWKRNIRDILLTELNLQGPERVLDVGCGTGFFLIGMAERLKSGRAIGLEPWAVRERTGPDITHTEENTRRANVADLVELHAGEYHQLPFPDASMDAVVCGWPSRKQPTADIMEKVIPELWRVLKSGGRICLVDVANISAYQNWLKQRNAGDIKMFGPRMDYPWPCYLLIAIKP